MVNKSVLLKKISQVRYNLSRLREKGTMPLELFKGDIDAQDIMLHNLRLAVQMH
jgi:hypothetical protein